MPQSALYKKTQDTEVTGFPGYDRPRDAGKIIISDQDTDVEIASPDAQDFAVDVEQIGGQAQSAVDVASKIQAIFDALASQGNDELRISTPSPIDASAATVPTEQQTPVGVEDASGTQVDPDQSPDYPNDQTAGYDLIGSGDLVVGPVSVARASAISIAANSTDDNTFSVSVDWEDGSGNVFQTESATDIGLVDVTQDWARLVRKGPQVEVTVTDTSGAAQNNVNVHVDVER